MTSKVKIEQRAVVVAQLAELSLPTREVCSLNPVIVKSLYRTIICYSTALRRQKLRKMIPGMAKSKDQKKNKLGRHFRGLQTHFRSILRFLKNLWAKFGDIFEGNCQEIRICSTFTQILVGQHLELEHITYTNTSWYCRKLRWVCHSNKWTWDGYVPK